MTNIRSKLTFYKLINSYDEHNKQCYSFKTINSYDKHNEQSYISKFQSYKQLRQSHFQVSLHSVFHSIIVCSGCTVSLMHALFLAYGKCSKLEQIWSYFLADILFRLETLWNTSSIITHHVPHSSDQSDDIPRDYHQPNSPSHVPQPPPLKEGSNYKLDPL